MGQFFRRVVRFVRSRLCRLAAVLGMLLAAGSTAYAAVEFKGVVGYVGDLYGPFGATVDALGNVYVADTGNHRVMKFTKRRNEWKNKQIGKLGYGHGELYYPQALAIADDPELRRSLLFVADSANNRVSVFDDIGNAVRQFGTWGAGDSLHGPAGIAVTPDGARVYVADSRNQRIVVFTQKGKWVKSFNCVACPQPLVTPAGLAIRQKEKGIELFVTDITTHRVHVMDQDGAWLRSFGTQGTEPGKLSVPDEIAVDDEGSAWVVESGFGAERVSKFDSQGHFQYAFSRYYGTEVFVQPHGIARGHDGTLYVVDSANSRVAMFKEAPGKLRGSPASGPECLQAGLACFFLTYNGVEQTCAASGAATITIEKPRPASFKISGGPWILNNEQSRMELSSRQAELIRRSWEQRAPIKILMSFRAECQDGEALRFKQEVDYLPDPE